MNISIEGHEWNFAKNTDQTYYYVNAAGKAVKFPTIKQTEIFNEDAMSNRGHIWNKTIPLLAKHIFIGSGANTYAYSARTAHPFRRNGCAIPLQTEQSSAG